MPNITVEEFAQDVGVSVKRIQEQLVEAGLSKKNAEDIITDVEKLKDKLRETLDTLTYEELAKTDQELTDAASNILKITPLGIYVG